MSSYPPHVITLIGPTASGKTELAIEIAEYFKTRIHNIDSRQIYRSMNIGTAKPSDYQQLRQNHLLEELFLYDHNVPQELHQPSYQLPHILNGVIP